MSILSQSAQAACLQTLHTTGAAAAAAAASAVSADTTAIARVTDDVATGTGPLPQVTAANGL